MEEQPDQVASDPQGGYQFGDPMRGEADPAMSGHLDPTTGSFDQDDPAESGDGFGDSGGAGVGDIGGALFLDDDPLGEHFDQPGDGDPVTGNTPYNNWSDPGMGESEDSTGGGDFGGDDEASDFDPPPDTPGMDM